MKNLFYKIKTCFKTEPKMENIKTIKLGVIGFLKIHYI